MKRFGRGKTAQVERALSLAYDTGSEWIGMQKHKDRAASSHHVTNDQLAAWEKPLCGVFKCNIDCAFSHDSTVAYYDICFRDSNGSFVLARSAIIHSSLSVQEGEALGILEALQLAHSMNFQRIIFESDCIVDALSSSLSNATKLGSILVRCYVILSSRSEFKIEFIRRQVNKVAHMLARASLSHTSSYMFYVVP